MRVPSMTLTTEPYVLGDLTIDYAQRLVSVAGRMVAKGQTQKREE